MVILTLVLMIYFYQAVGAVPPHPIHAHYTEFASWMVPLALFTWSAVGSKGNYSVQYQIAHLRMPLIMFFFFFFLRPLHRLREI